MIGKIRPSSSENTARKVPVGDYIRRYAPERGDVAEGESGAEDRGIMASG